MPKVVKCDVCGGLYNQSHLSSHKRLSHGKRESSSRSSKDESASLEMILSVYERLSDEGKRKYSAFWLLRSKRIRSLKTQRDQSVYLSHMRRGRLQQDIQVVRMDGAKLRVLFFDFSVANQCHKGFFESE